MGVAHKQQEVVPQRRSCDYCHIEIAPFEPGMQRAARDAIIVDLHGHCLEPWKKKRQSIVIVKEGNGSRESKGYRKVVR